MNACTSRETDKRLKSPSCVQEGDALLFAVIRLVNVIGHSERTVCGKLSRMQGIELILACIDLGVEIVDVVQRKGGGKRWRGQREVRPWFSRAYYASFKKLQEFLAENMQAEFAGMVSDAWTL